MKTRLLFAYRLGVAIVCLSSTLEGSTHVSYHGGINSKKVLRPETTPRNSDRLLREQIARRTSSLGETVNHIWAAAVEETADTISSTHDKCRLADGTVVINGEPYYGKGKSKSKSKSGKSCRSAKGSKGSLCVPTYQSSEPDTSSDHLPSASLTDCYGKGKSCKLNKKKDKSDKSQKSKISISSSHSKSAKSAKGKYKDANLPYCDEMTPTTSPTRNEGANTSPPTDSPNNPSGESTDTPTFAPTTADEFARCNDISNGTGNMTGEPDQIFKLYVLVESANALEDGFAERLNTAMRTILALASGCRNTDFSAMTSRRLQENPPEAVELDGFEILDLAGLTCEQAFGVEVSADVCTAFESLVRAFGGEITEDIEQICQDFGPQLAAALGVENIRCVVDRLPFDILVPTISPNTEAPTGPTVSPTAPPTASPTISNTASLTTSPTESNGSGPDGITDRDGQTIETGGWIIMAAGILVLFSLCLCYFCNRRTEKERGMAAYAKTYDDGESSMGDNANEGVTSRAIFVNPDQEPENYDSDKYAPTDIAPTDEEEEYPVKRSLKQPDDDYFDAEQASSSSPVDDMMLHEKGEVCSSPTCRLCEDRRREGPMALSAPRRSNKNTQYPDRGYIQDDTVEL